jgi:regulator of protease activity HflC (stomatin/prohibitin superfamily)
MPDDEPANPKDEIHAMPSPHETRRRLKHPGRSGAIAFVAVIGLVVVLCELFGGWARTDGGHVAVIRNGGPFSNTQVQRVINPGSSLKFVGFYASTHPYPASQRFYTIASNGSGDRPGVDVVQVPTADGIEVGVEGTVYFSLNLQRATLGDFDDKYGTRSYRGADGTQRNAYDGNDGWNSFLDQIVRPVIDNDLRIAVGSYRCSELLPSCALVQNSAVTGPAKVSRQGSGNVNLSKIEQALAESLQSDLNTSLGGPFLTNVRFNLAKVSLPAAIQKAVDDAQAAYAGVSQSQARVKQAQLDAQADEQRQKGYNACHACSQIDIIKALPSGVTVFAPGAGSGFPLTGPVK